MWNDKKITVAAVFAIPKIKGYLIPSSDDILSSHGVVAKNQIKIMKIRGLNIFTISSCLW